MIDSKLNDLIDKKDSLNIFFLFLFSLSFVLSLLIFLTLTGNLSNLEQIDNVSDLIKINFTLIVILILISFRKIKENFDNRKFKSKFKVQFTLLFIFITLIPSTLITIFSLIICPEIDGTIGSSLPIRIKVRFFREDNCSKSFSSNFWYL